MSEPLIKTTLAYRENQYIALMQLNRPEKLNALTTEILEAIVQTLEQWQKEKIIRTVIITGNERAFCAGANIKKMVSMQACEQYNDQREALWKRFTQIKIPLIAAVNGFCLGAGNELAMSCDLIIAGDKAKFGQPEINIGTIPGAGGTQRLTKAMGKSKAMYHALTGDFFSAEQAYQWGLISQVVPWQTLLTETYLVAKKIAEKSPLAASLIKEAINNSFETPLSQGLQFERRQFYLTFASEDQKEGMNAFLEKRTPSYKGL